MMMNDPGHGGWYMDTRATSHIHGDAGLLSIILNKSNFFSYVLVGDGSLILVTNVGHTAILYLNPYHTLHLKNILITPQIIKTLIFVHQVVNNNSCSIEFYSFGFL